MGNKGAVAVRFTVFDSSFCFVNSHLAAQATAMDRRNADYSDLSKKLLFGSKTIFDADYLFWLGDLNYRINLPRETVLKLLEIDDFDTLLSLDQLKLATASKKAFADFDEAPITFRPTFKFDIGGDDYDTSEKLRVPSWTDRILFKQRHRSGYLRPHTYSSHPEYVQSDHKPVSLDVEVAIDTILENLESQIKDEVRAAVESLEVEARPRARCSVGELYFSDVRYMCPQTQTVILSNAGSAHVHYSLVPMSHGKRVCKEWVWVVPSSGVLPPSTSQQLSVTVLVDDDSATSLNLEKDVLYNVLLIHITSGQDITVSVRGGWKQSCFGSSLARLNDAGSNEHNHHMATQLTSTDVPAVIRRLCDIMTSHVAHGPRLVATSSDPDLVRRIWKHLDNRTEFERGGQATTLPTISALLESLLRLLGTLADPVIPYQNYEEALEAHDSYAGAVEVAHQDLYHRTVLTG